MKRKKVKNQRKIVKSAVKPAPKPASEARINKKLTKKVVQKVADSCKGDPEDICGRGGCLHPRSIHITGECHSKGCVCVGFIE